MRIIIIGCGRMGSGLAKSLSLRGHQVTVIDEDPSRFEQLGPAFQGRTITGVGFDRGVLIQAGIERTDALASVTPSDEVNVIAARLAGQVFRVPRVVARLYDPRKAEIYRRLGLQTIDPVAWGVNRIADLLCYSPLDTVLSLGGGEVDVVQTGLSPLLAGRRVNDLTVPGEIQVIAISRGGQTFIPTLGTVFQEGDLIHLTVASSSGDRLRALLGLA
jgi:trk system potassium uptake protein TrkA